MASDDDAVNFFNSIIVEATLSPVEGMASKDFKEDTSKYSGQAGSVINSATDEDEKGVLDHASRSGKYDVWIPDDQKRFRNTRFYDFVQKCIVDDVVTIMSPSSARIKATILAMSRTKTVENTMHPARFMRRRDDGSWTVLDDQESVESVLCFIVDALTCKVTVSSVTPAGDLRSLISLNGIADLSQFQESSTTPVQEPTVCFGVDALGCMPIVLTFAFAGDLSKSVVPSVGIADLSQFRAFSKPSTAPVRVPTEFDVLSGVGGTTYRHPGNATSSLNSLPRLDKPLLSRQLVAAI